MQLQLWMTVLFWVIALIASGFYGIMATRIFFDPETVKSLSSVQRCHQSWLNFLGALVGWLVFWLLLRKFGGCVIEECTSEFGAWDAVGALVAFVGLTGYLPNVIVSLVAGVARLAGKLVEGLAAWISGASK